MTGRCSKEAQPGEKNISAGTNRQIDSKETGEREI